MINWWRFFGALFVVSVLVMCFMALIGNIQFAAYAMIIAVFAFIATLANKEKYLPLAEKHLQDAIEKKDKQIER